MFTWILVFGGSPRAPFSKIPFALRLALFFQKSGFFITQFLTFFCKLSQLGWAPAGEFFGTFQAMAGRWSECCGRWSECGGRWWEHAQTTVAV